MNIMSTKTSSGTTVRESDIERPDKSSLSVKIKELFNLDRTSYPVTILLFGKVGSGKSSVINTLYRVLTGIETPIAPAGGGDSSVTLKPIRYENLGIKSDLLIGNSRIPRDDVTQLPNIIDVAGMSDTNSEGQKEIVELLIGGFLQPGTDIPHLLELQRSKGVGYLKQLLMRPNQERTKISKIVFVQSCTDPVPRELIQCLRSTLKLTDDATLQHKYNVDVFVLITKCDLVQGLVESSQPINASSVSINMEDLENKEADIAKEFSIIGTLAQNSIRWASYSDRITSDNGYIESAAVDFVKRMMLTYDQAVNENVQPIFRGNYLMDIRWYLHRKCMLIVCFAVMPVCLGVVAMLYSLLSQTP